MKSLTKTLHTTDLLLAFSAVIAVCFYVLVANGGFPLDDSWIHQVYGRNLAQTGVWSFIPGVPSAASTSPLYTVLLSLGYKLGLDYRFWTHFLGIIALGVSAVLAAHLTSRLLPGRRVISFLGGLVVVGAWHLVWAAASGMETMLFSMWTLVLITLTWREWDNQQPLNTTTLLLRGALFGASAALSTITRPEGIVLAGIAGILILVARPHDTFSKLLIWIAGAGLAFLVFVAPYLALNIQLTGGLLPDTAAAKQAEYAPLLLESYPVRFWNMLLPLLASAALFLLPGIVYYTIVIIKQVSSNHKQILALLPVFWSLALVALYAARLPAYYQHGRYVIPALPALLVVGFIGTVWLIRNGSRSMLSRVLTRSVALSFLIGALYFFVQGAWIYKQDVAIIDQEMVTSARWIQANIPPEDLLAVHDIGAVGYFAPRPILDLAGLVSPEIVPFILDGDALWNWLQEKDARYLMAFPEHIPGDDPRNDVNDPRLCPVFTSGGTASLQSGGPNMVIYAFNWGEGCP